MNRRKLLQALSVLSASCAWTLMPTSLRANGTRAVRLPGEESLLLALTESKGRCDAMLAERESLLHSRGSLLGAELQQLCRLIDEARSRVTQRGPNGPAFWQACGDAFFRTADLLAAHRIQHQTPHADFHEAEKIFRRTSERLAAETVRSTTARLPV